MLMYGKYMSVFVMQMLYICVLCACCDSSQCCILHDLQVVNAGRGCKRMPYWVAMSVSFCLPHPVAVSAFIICSGLCAFTEML